MHVQALGVLCRTSESLPERREAQVEWRKEGTMETSVMQERGDRTMEHGQLPFI